MLDVHAPHEGIHTWRAFVIHIAAISVGLLLALGLERLAEYVHHRGQLADARRTLEAELGTNSKVLDVNLAEARRIATALDANQRALQPGREATVGSSLDYKWNVRWPSDGTWQVVRTDGSLGLMPHAELQRYVYLYEGVDYEMRNLDAVAQQLDRCAAISERSGPGPMTARDIDELIGATTEAQGRIKYLLDLLTLQRASFDRVRARSDSATVTGSR
jgi:hypothetical protein